MANVVDVLADRAFAIAASKGVQVRVKTNVTPEVVMYDAADLSPSLLAKIGVKYRVTIVDGNGNTLASYGEPVSFNPVLFVALGAALFFAVTLIGATIARVVR